ncbi:hypothetical protein C7M52_01464 [Mixta theicola]|nr:hypothetical protein C7M52_01464 [Mixta theicola]
MNSLKIPSHRRNTGRSSEMMRQTSARVALLNYHLPDIYR